MYVFDLVSILVNSFSFISSEFIGLVNKNKKKK